MTDVLLITCEHGGNAIPLPFRPMFHTHRELLDSHRGWDPGALVMAKALSESFGAPLVASTTSRLLIDLNRSVGHPQLFSSVMQGACDETRSRIVELNYRPYRRSVEDLVQRSVVAGRRVIHISSHSFTPELDGVVREADVGLLYDPGRPGELDLSARWKASLATLSPKLHVRRNYPYEGKADGLTTHLRSRFTPTDYVGIELEINQRIVLAEGRPWAGLRDVLIDSLRAACTPPT